MYQIIPCSVLSLIHVTHQAMLYLSFSYIECVLIYAKINIILIVCIKCVLFINIKCGYVRVQVSLTAIEGAGVFVWESAMQTESTPPMKKIYKDWRRGFMYLCAIIDLHTRYVVNWGLSNTMSALWVRQIVEDAIEMHGQPEIINSDQGSQFTASEYISLLTERDNPIAVSMDGKGRAIDNIFVERLWKSVKYECVYLHAFEDGVKLYKGLLQYFNFYNTERLHQSLDYKTPESLYRNVA